MQNTGNTAKSDSNKDISSPQARSGAMRDTEPKGSSGSGDSPAIASAATVTQIKDQAREFTEKAQEALTDVAHRAQEYGEKAIEETRSFVKNNPGQALLAGFGVGFLLGYALSRR